LQRIQQEPTLARKQALLEKYAAQYPQASSIAWVYEQLLSIYKDAKDEERVIAIANALLSADPNDLDAAHDALRASQATGATVLTRIFAERAWDIASKVVLTPKPSDPDDAADWNKQIEFAREVLSYSEFVMATQAADEPDPAMRAALIEALQSRNPQSKFLANAKKTVVDLAKVDPEKAVALAEQGLVKDPNNEDFLMTVADYKLSHQKELPRVLTYSLRILEIMKTKPKPAALSVEEWQQKKARFTGWASWMAGVVYGKQAHYTQSDRYLREALPRILDNTRLLGAAYYYLGYDNYAIATESGDTNRAFEAAKFSKLCVGIDGPYRPLAQKTLASLRTDFSVQ
jgi:tetratricopeptide (TPR) repeat protein